MAAEWRANKSVIEVWGKLIVSRIVGYGPKGSLSLWTFLYAELARCHREERLAAAADLGTMATRVYHP